MKQIVLNVKESKYAFFIELIKSLNFVKIASFNSEVDKEPTKEEVLANIEQGFKELKLYKEGKMKFTPIEEFLNEL